MNIALILAAGTGSRMGNSDKPKQFLLVQGKPLMVHTIEVFDVNPNIDKIVISTNEEYVEEVKLMIKQYDLTKVAKVVAGGATRQISVYNGLQGCKEIGAKDDDIIVIYSQQTQIYRVLENMGSYTDESGGRQTKFFVIDQDEDYGYVRLRIEKNGNSQVYIDFNDVMWVYNVKRIYL